jgi:hypothetical protein
MSARSVVVVVVIVVVGVWKKEMGEVVSQKLFSSSLGRLTLDVSVAASAPTVEVAMMVSRTVRVDSAATGLKFDQSSFRPQY